MANRPFTIQDNAISLNGTEISASVDGKVVIPGITASAGYRVEEVDDTGDQSRTWSQSDPFTVIDNGQFSVLNGDWAGTGFTPAVYTAEIDGEGYIDNISIDSNGTIPADQTIWFDVDFMWATAAADPINTFVPSDWVQIPFKTKLRSLTIEADPTSPFQGGGGGLVEREVNFPTGETGDTRGTIALTPQDGTFVCVADYVEPETLSVDATTNQGFDTSQTGGQFIEFDLTAEDYPDLQAIFGVWGGVSQENYPYPEEFTIEASGVDGVRTCVNCGYNANGDMYFTIEYVSGDPTNFASGSELTITYVTSQLPDIWVRLDNNNIDRLTNANGDTFLLDEWGNIQMPETGGGAIWFNYGYIDQDENFDNNTLRVSGGDGVSIYTAEDGKN